jgi:hypothetical protein
LTVPTLGPLANREHLGILVLAETQQKCKAIQKQVKARRAGDPVRVLVRLGPSPATIAKYLEERRADHGASDGA